MIFFLNQMNTKRIMSPLKQQNESIIKKIKLQPSDELTKEMNKEIAPAMNDEFDNILDDIDWGAFDKIEKCSNQAKLDLSVWQRCTVEEVLNDRQLHAVILTVKGENSRGQHLQSKCYLKGTWCHTKISKGDVVSLKAVWDENLHAFLVDQEHGMCVNKPDTLISGTTVVGSLFCRRKAVLQDRFRGIDANSKIMVIGSLVHELLQQVLQEGLRTTREIETAAKNILGSASTAFLLYSSKLCEEDIKLEIIQYIPSIEKLLNQYLGSKTSNVAIEKDNFQGYISEIEDIEENLWVPQLGLKGKIDVSVGVQMRNSKNLADAAQKQPTRLPIELKTGRATFSMEHKGQLILYQMMLTAANKPTRSGLLLYLKESIMREVIGTRNEQRDLINLRNDLCHYLTSLTGPAQIKNELPEGKFPQPLLLPEPITHPTACQQCPYQTLCCVFARTDQNLHITRSHGIEKLIRLVTEHLTQDDFKYFLNWCSLLIMEEKEAKKCNNLSNLWTRKPADRQQQGTALCELILSAGNVVHEASQFLHEFKSKENCEDKIDFTLSGFAIGEYVIVSTYTRLAVAAGVIMDLTATSIAVNLERNLLKKYAADIFIIDKHESMSHNIFNFTNLGVLMDNTKRSQQLREIIIHLKRPECIDELPENVLDEAANILVGLNGEQRVAVLKCLATQDYLLIKGLPGTGKTQMLVALVRLLHAMNKSVIITSHTHSAVDNLLLRLQRHDLPFLRLGSTSRVHPSLYDSCESRVIGNYQLYNTFNIVGVTCLGSSHPIFLHRHFDVCIVDEATQVMQPTVMRPLFHCDRFILVGDPDQLPPLIRSPEARQGGADVSLFERLSHCSATVMLSLQYRMNKTITRLANKLTYDGKLKCASEHVQQATIALPIPSHVLKERWLKRTLETHIDQAVVLLDTLNCLEISANYEQQLNMKRTLAAANIIKEVNSLKKSRLSKYNNYCEAAVIFYLLRALLQAGYSAQRIGIIAPYRAQVELLNKLLCQHHKYFNQRATDSGAENMNLDFSMIEINTVDQYQGRDKDIIIYSCTRTGSTNCKEIERSRDAEILEDNRRLTVAVTRAKYKLIIIGDVCCLKQYKPFDKLINAIPGYCKLKLEDDKLDFKWQTLFKQLSQVNVDG